MFESAAGIPPDLTSWLQESLSLVVAVSYELHFLQFPACPELISSIVSGLSAAHTIYLAGGNVLLLDKNSMLD